MPKHAQHHPMADGHAPDWACEWGQDKHGIFAGFAVDDLVQRMRWIPPGWFWMGSPEDEPGRWDDEGPRHRVQIARGYWLFDTPCTQALWQAVMGGNPSHFQDPERLVEQVSFENVQEFLSRINQRVPGLDLCLPSEAQWEHACRAGTDTALYSGPIEILGAHNAPDLDAIAWYGGNSGVDYDLDEAHDTSDRELWNEMQYQTDRAGSRKVKGKAPNPWGLHDMLGNVWEWVEDAWHDNFTGAPGDGSVWAAGDDADRVVRGGSWYDEARYCRCATRLRFRPEVRIDYLGFRCARVQW